MIKILKYQGLGAFNSIHIKVPDYKIIQVVA